MNSGNSIRRFRLYEDSGLGGLGFEWGSDCLRALYFREVPRCLRADKLHGHAPGVLHDAVPVREGTGMVVTTTGGDR